MDKKYTIEDIAKDQSDLCDKIAQTIREFESKYGVAVVDLDYRPFSCNQKITISVRFNH